MSEKYLKPGWKMVKFGDMVKNANLVERDPEKVGIERVVGLDHLDPENLHIRRWNTLEEGTSFTRKFVPDQTLFAKRRAYQRKIAFAEFEGICSGDILTFEPKDPKKLLPELLPFICQTDAFFDHALGTSAGSLSPRTSWKALKDFEFHLPPIEEQKHIAEILWATDEAVERYLSTIKELQNTRSFYFANISLSKVENKWRVKKFVDCFEIVSGQVDPKDKLYQFLPLVAPNHIQQYTGRLLNIETAKEQNAISGKYLFQKGDVVYSKIRPNLRKAFISEFEGMCSADMYALRPKQDKIIARFLLAILLSDHFTSFALTRSVRTGIPKLNRKELSEYKIAIPPIDEQKRICAHLETLDLEEENLLKHRSLLVEVKNQICRECLEGCYV